MTRTLYVPAFDEAEARVIAESIARGETGQLAQHTDRDEVDRICAYLNRSRPAGAQYQTFAVPVRARFVDDGLIHVAWPSGRVGDMAAAFLITVVGPFAVGIASLYEVMA
jgi:hypothetical protein